jgi:hypothetical protein
MSALSVVDPVAWARERPEQFFPGGQIDAIHLLSYVMADVLELGKGTCVIWQEADWWIVGSDVDWLRHPRYSDVELFSVVVPAPAHGEHSMRAEILVFAFAQDVWTCADGRQTCIRGAPPPTTIGRSAGGLRRLLAFTCKRSL